MPATGAHRPAILAERLIATLRFLLGLFAGLALFFMMMLTVVDVFGRKLLDHPLFGGLEMTELGMLVLIFGALPLASLAREHVVFDLIDAWLSPRVRRVQAVLANLLSAILLSVVAVFVWNKAGHTREMGDITAQLAIPVAPFQFAGAVMLAVTAACHLWLAYAGWREAGRPPPPQPAVGAATGSDALP